MGLLRLVLALFVVVFHAGGHLVLPLPGARLSMYEFGGRDAVGVFFLISGFYMSLILSDKYRGALATFYLNRFLRIFPPYWVVLLLSLALTPGRLARIWAELQTTTSGARFYFLFCNTFVVGSDAAYLVSARPEGLVWQPFALSADHNGSGLLVIPPIFSVALELTFYAIAPLLVRDLRWTFAALAASLAWHVAIIATGETNVVFSYHLFPADLLYFTVGILAHRLADIDWRRLPNRWYGAGAAVAVVVLFVQPQLPNLYVLVVPFALPSLFAATRSNRIDRFLGDLSYPLYLVHFPVIQLLVERGVGARFRTEFAVGMSLLIAVALHVALERPIERIRQRLAGAYASRSGAVIPAS